MDGEAIEAEKKRADKLLVAKDNIKRLAGW